MGQAVPSQNPAVVLRSHFNQLRASLAIAVVVLVVLSVALVVVATDDESTSTTAKPVPSITDVLGGRAGVATPDVARPESAPLAQQEHPLRSRVGAAQPDAPITGSRYDGAADEGTPGPKDYSKNSATGDF